MKDYRTMEFPLFGTTITGEEKIPEAGAHTKKEKRRKKLIINFSILCVSHNSIFFLKNIIYSDYII